VDSGRQLVGLQPLPRHEHQFNFSLPSSFQGFELTGPSKDKAKLCYNRVDDHTGLVLVINPMQLEWTPDDAPLEVMTPTFTPKEVMHASPHYQMLASPLVYPGQVITAIVLSSTSPDAKTLTISLRAKAYDSNDDLLTIDSDPQPIASHGPTTLTWTLPQTLQNNPIQQLGLAVHSTTPVYGVSLWLQSLGWSGTPTTTFRHPPLPTPTPTPTPKPTLNLWAKAWRSSADIFHTTLTPTLQIAHSTAESLSSTGTLDWTDYSATFHALTLLLPRTGPSGAAIRVQGLRRWYALLFVRGAYAQKGVALVKARDETRQMLAVVDFEWEVETGYEVTLEARGAEIRGRVAGVGLRARDAGVKLRARDAEYAGGGVGIVVTEGAVEIESIDVAPCTPVQNK
jgi:hypothetical protein